MHTITLLVDDFDEQRQRLPVQMIPNDGLDTAMQLSALRVAENIVIGELLREAEMRGREAVELEGEEADEN
jgi:hypothetical protein